jgi:hypothetical protein
MTTTNLPACTFESINHFFGCNHPASQLYFLSFDVYECHHTDTRKSIYFVVHGNTLSGGWIDCATIEGYENRKYNLKAGHYNR